jgi:OOP family OmpA-OmpF porin
MGIGIAATRGQEDRVKSALVSWLVVAAFALAAAGAHAQAQPAADRGWYAGIGLGQSKIDFGSNPVPAFGVTSDTISADDTDSSYKLLGGYRFNRYLALEGGYTDFGSFSATRRVTAPGSGTVTSNIKTSGVHFDVMGIIPAGDRFEFFGKVGLIRTVTQTDLSTTGSVVLIGPAHSTDYNVSPRIGIGAYVRFTRALGLRIEYEQQDIDFQIFGESASVGIASASLVFRF